MCRVVKTTLLLFATTAFVGLAALAAAVTGDQVFVDETTLRLPADADFSRDVDLVDVDADGDLDIYFTNSARYGPGDGQPDRLYINDGSGMFTDESAARLPVESDDTRGAAFADYDGDGDLDVALSACNGDRPLLWFNDGNGFFMDVTVTNFPDLSATCFFLIDTGDADGDGDFDLYLCGYFDPSRLLINDGTGRFADESLERLPALSQDQNLTTSALFVDVDRDGDLDIQETNFGRNRLLINDGRGRYRDESEARIPDDSRDSWGVAAADVDGSGALDLIINNTAYQHENLWLNAGGHLEDVSAERLPDLSTAAFDGEAGDVDNDGWPDLVFANRAGPVPLQNVLFRNVGDGFFEDVTLERMPPLLDQSAGIAMGDLDRDGDLDLVVANVEDRNRLYVNLDEPDAWGPDFMLPVSLPAVRGGLGPFPVVAQVIDYVSLNIGEIGVALWFSTDGGDGYQERQMAWRGGRLYSGEIPAQPLGTDVRYYFSAVDAQGNSSTLPYDAPARTFGFVVGGRIGYLEP